jgi:uncharacterized protein YdeI (YjbR/CyaY-like superfamily)
MALTRPTEPMPRFVAEALDAADLRAAYDARPPYQRNDYLGWINGAKRDETKEKRLRQMLAELQAGEGYMNMSWRPRD